MSAFPHTGLFFRNSLTIAISGPHIQVLDSTSGELWATTADLGGDELQTLLKTGPIRCAAVDLHDEHIVVSADDKVLRVYTVDGLKLVSSREAPKKPTSIEFSQDGQTIIVSDKFGDVFSYPLHPSATPSANLQAQKNEFSSHENTAGGKLILGHTSLLTTFLLTQDEKYIITADRDEHVRVSWYPQGYIIESYCLGHEQFVSTIHIPRFDLSTLVSGGGDPSLKVWDWLSGKLKYDIAILDAVTPFIKVFPEKGKGSWGASGEDNDGRKKLQGRRGCAKARKTREETQEAASSTAEAIVHTIEHTSAAMEDSPPAAVPEADAEPVLVIRKIASLDPSGSSGRLLFSALGATALFTCPYGSLSAAGSIQSIDFHKPVLDFVVAGTGLVWVLVDGEWQTSSSIAETSIADPTMVHVVRWTGEELVKLSEGDPAVSHLLSKLNTNCLIQASTEQLQRLDLYSALSSLPKLHEGAHDVGEDAATLGDDLESGTSTPTTGLKGKGKALSGKEMARIKHRKAVQERLKAQEFSTAGVLQVETSNLEEASREVKRSRSDQGAAGLDAEMVEA